MGLGWFKVRFLKLWGWELRCLKSWGQGLGFKRSIWVYGFLSDQDLVSRSLLWQATPDVRFQPRTPLRATMWSEVKGLNSQGQAEFVTLLEMPGDDTDAR